MVCDHYPQRLYWRNLVDGVLSGVGGITDSVLSLHTNCKCDKFLPIRRHIDALNAHAEVLHSTVQPTIT